MPISNPQGHDGASSRTAARNRKKRTPISCLPCRYRKLKCDRTLPACSNCINRGDITACSYVPKGPEPHKELQQSLELPAAALSKIDNLERLVRTLLENQASVEEEPDTPTSFIDVDAQDGRDSNSEKVQQSHKGINQNYGMDSPRITTGTVGLDTSIQITATYKQPSYVNEAHWALLLSDIGDVRSYLNAQHQRYEQQNDAITQILRRSAEEPGPTLLLGSARKVTRAAILSQLPSRYMCDIIIARFFQHLYPAMYIIHPPTFQKQYEAFWADTSKTSMVWVALLFAMSRVAMIDYIREGDEPIELRGKGQDLANDFCNTLTDCLILADYTKPHEFLIEALSYHFYAEYASTREANSNVWVLLATVIRLATKMNYHQQTQPSLSLSPFQCEMRRRVWTFISQADIMISFQMGLPSMIGVGQLDLAFPRNIVDESFDENCSKLPASLPDCESTQISFLIAKTRLVHGFVRALDEIGGPGIPKWERILEIDRELRQIYDSVPFHYKLCQLSEEDSLVLISARFVLASIHHKSLCVLHSRLLEGGQYQFQIYLFPARLPEFSHVNSALPGHAEPRDTNRGTSTKPNKLPDLAGDSRLLASSDP